MGKGPETVCNRLESILLFLIKHGAILGEATGYLIKHNMQSLQWLNHAESHSHSRANVENGCYKGGGIREYRNGVPSCERERQPVTHGQAGHLWLPVVWRLPWAGFSSQSDGLHQTTPLVSTGFQMSKRLLGAAHGYICFSSNLRVCLREQTQPWGKCHTLCSSHPGPH